MTKIGVEENVDGENINNEKSSTTSSTILPQAAFILS
jgi:hypothetical protein